uniref:BZIP domain-containing protein n=1 Tax=Parascaris univalens TaxID=6257 RepID=A0A915BKL8_PARUN
MGRTYESCVSDQHAVIECAVRSSEVEAPATKSLSLDASTLRCTQAESCPTHSSPYRVKVVLIGRDKKTTNSSSAFCGPSETHLAHRPVEPQLSDQSEQNRSRIDSSQSVETNRAPCKSYSTMSLEPPRYDVDELGPLLDEFNPLSEFYVAPRYDADLRPLYQDDYSPCTSEASPSASLLDVFAPTYSSTAPAHDTLQQEQPNAFLTNCSGSEFRRGVDDDNGSPAAVVPAQSTFEAIIREDHYEDSVAVQLDHSYGAPAASSTSTASIELDPSILNEFLSPFPSTSSMGPCEDGAANVSSTYLETFTNLEPYLQHREDSSTPPGRGIICDTEPASAAQSTSAPTVKPDSTVSDATYATSRTRLETPDEYRRRRDKNNIASQRSRRKRQEKFQALKEEEIGLKKRNTELLATVGDLERQVNNLKEIMMKAISG